MGPRELVDQAVRAQEAGFDGLWISDHYRPWNDEQGHSPFVWSTIGAIATTTDMKVTTAVTCPSGDRGLGRGNLGDPARRCAIHGGVGMDQDSDRLRCDLRGRRLSAVRARP